MRLIPGKIRVQIELFKKVTLADIFFGAVVMAMILFVAISSLPGKLIICAVITFLAAFLLARIDSVPNYIYILHILRHMGLAHHYGRVNDDSLLEAKQPGEFDQMIFDRLFVEEPEIPRVYKRPGKEDKKRRKEEDKLLKSKTATEEEKAEIRKKRATEADAYCKRKPMEDIIAFTGIKDDCIEYDGRYYGAAIEIPPVELRFFSSARRINSIENSLGRVLRSINAEYSANIVKLDRPIMYDRDLDREYDRLDELKASFENGLLKEEEYKARVEILYNRIHEIRSLCYDRRVVAPCYCLVLFESDKRQLENLIASALKTLEAGEMKPHRLNTQELAVFLKYTNQIDFDERSIQKIMPEDYALWAMPMTVDIRPRSVVVNHIISYTMRMVGYPTMVGDAWLAGVMSMPGTKCVVKCRPMERSKAIRGIDRSLQELRGQMMTTGIDSRRMELQDHIDTLSELLATLQRENESLLEVNVYVTAYDIVATRENKRLVQPPPSELPNITNMKKAVRRLYRESGFRLNNMEFDQTQAFIGSQISGWDPMLKESRGIPSNSLAACYPWIYAHVADEGGMKLGTSDGVPVMIDFFRRDSERVNSNMVIVGKSGSGKSFATKSILENLAAEDCKIFILDPENEYAELAANLHGKFINVGNAQYGRLNPFHIITALDDDEEEGAGASGSYATHLQFLEEFFRQILPDCDKDAMEYLNNMVDRMYIDHGITSETELSKLKPEDYPIFDDLYDAIMQEFQQTDNEYIRSILRTLMNYIAKFSTGGRNANIWNGPSTVTTDENFTVFNFQSLLANRNSTIANAQMLLVLKYIDNEIIKNRDYNLRYHLNRKIAVVIDEAHVFIDTKFPVALDFMFQLAKRIRKYNGMQIVITQNIKDFVGSEEIARKSTAIINACQYSMIFSLAPNDIQDLCRLYEKAGGINEREQEQITSAPRGQAFAVMSPSSRTSFQVEVKPEAAAMFENQQFQSRYFSGEDGAAVWETVVGDSRGKFEQKQLERWGSSPQTAVSEEPSHSYVTFTEIEEETPVQAETGAVSFTEETVTVQTAQEQSVQDNVPSSTERMLSDLLGRFSYSSMVEEIRRTVREEMARERTPKGGTGAAGMPLPDASPEIVFPTVPSPTEVPPPVPAAAVQNPEAAAVSEYSAAPEQDAESEAAAEAAYDDTPEEAAEADFSGTEEQETESKADGRFLNAWAEADEEPEDEEQGETAAQQEYWDEQDTDEEPFDIMELLAQQAEKLQNVNPIDMMVTYDEEVTDVTLEELMQFIQTGK